MSKFLDMSGIASLFGRMRNAAYSDQRIANVDPMQWPSAGQPVQPVGPPGSQSLVFPFLYGQNLTYTPRADAAYTAADLRGLATFPLARICIDNTKDSLCQTPWSIELRQQPGESPAEMKARRKRDSKGDSNITMLSNLFEWPDGQHDWSEWLRRTDDIGE